MHLPLISPFGDMVLTGAAAVVATGSGMIAAEASLVSSSTIPLELTVGLLTMIGTVVAGHVWFLKRFVAFHEKQQKLLLDREKSSVEERAVFKEVLSHLKGENTQIKEEFHRDLKEVRQVIQMHLLNQVHERSKTNRTVAVMDPSSDETVK